MTHNDAGEFTQAEQAYRQSLSIAIQQDNKAIEANNLGNLGNLYAEWNHPEQALGFYRQAMDAFSKLGDKASIGRQCNNIAITLVKLQRYDEARPELLRAIECNETFGHEAEP